ncbi:MAG: glycoside hydrolase family 130 protein [Acidimicrobiales bacterium]
MTGSPPTSDLVTRSDVRLRPDASRTLATLFLPGEELPGDHSRVTAVIDRVLALDDAEALTTLADLRARFTARHRAIDEIFCRHYDIVASRLGTRVTPPVDRRLLIGAYFTHEETPEGAALTNPSMVAHPDQSGVAAGGLRFILSARAVGEGHRSSIEFRTGVITVDAQVSIDAPGARLETAQPQPPVHRASVFWTQLAGLGAADDTAHLVLDGLGDTFDGASLRDAIAALDARLLSRQASRDVVQRLEWIAANNYRVTFSANSDLSERVLTPMGPSESNGVEDARFVRCVDDDGTVTYAATYTAYDGTRVVPQLLRTDDFRTFTAHQLSGAPAKNKGMALFPRRIRGRHAALSRWDRERLYVAWSDDGLAWADAGVIHAPRRAWELIQVGNCGSPIETTDGWLVLTHGVGPMRSYAIGAMLLDLDHPGRVIATLPEPLIFPESDESDGYVPNVVYSCGALRHLDHLVVPYGVGDQSVAVALVDLPGLLDRLARAAPGRQPASASRRS